LTCRNNGLGGGRNAPPENMLASVSGKEKILLPAIRTAIT
jgi:hypothetical protein